MLLDELLASLPGVIARPGPSSIEISQITADSRQVIPGALFVAYRGVGVDGHEFVPAALARGAVAVVGEQLWPNSPVPYTQVQDARSALSWLMSGWYGHPSRSMLLVGITGTDGKTTTANLLFSILRAARRRAGLISTVNAVIGDRTYDTGLHVTTPDAGDVQRYMAEMQAAGTEAVVLETTSHGLAQGRVSGCAFDVAVVTNITHEHLDFHGSYEAYRAAKALLFRSLSASPQKGHLRKTAVLNRDDVSYEFLAAIPAERQITYGLRPPSQELPGSVTLSASAIERRPGGTGFDLILSEPLGAQQVLRLDTPLLGDYNLSNIMAAAGAALALDLPLGAIVAGVRSLQAVPGRMERIDLGQDFAAFVDFAHTPNALARALETVRGLAAPRGRVIVVFGSAGLRDREKRRLMGEVAAELADYTIITAEDPRTEDLDAIIAETASACVAACRQEGRDFVRIPDRQRALLHAVQTAQAGDVVLSCGKGHEQSMCFGTVEHPWLDQQALRWALQRLTGDAGEDPPFVLPTWSAHKNDKW